MLTVEEKPKSARTKSRIEVVRQLQQQLIRRLSQETDFSSSILCLMR